MLTTATPAFFLDACRMDWEQRIAELHRQASELHAYAPHWVTFVEVVWARLIPMLFPSDVDRLRLEQTSHYAELVQWRDALRSQTRRYPRWDQSMITVRLPAAVHAVLVREAGDRRLSLNELCVRRLLQPSPGEAT